MTWPTCVHQIRMRMVVVGMRKLQLAVCVMSQVFNKFNGSLVTVVGHNIASIDIGPSRPGIFLYIVNKLFFLFFSFQRKELLE